MKAYAVLISLMLVSLPASLLANEVYVYKRSDGARVFTDQKQRKDSGYTYIGRYGRATFKADCGGYLPSIMQARRERYQKLVRQYAAEFQVDAALVEAVMRVESCLDRTAVSRAGARGLMQLMPATARELGVRNSFDPAENIRGGTQYLSMMLKRFGNNKKLALAAYNAGPNAVRRHNGVPPFAETQKYIKRVTRQYQLYQKS